MSDSGFSGAVATNLLLRTGNVELFRIGIRGRVDHQTTSTSSFIMGRGDLGLLGSDRFYNTGLMHLRLGWRWRPALMPEAYAQVNYDEPRLLEFRSVGGGGIRITAADREATGLWIGTGYMFEYERLDLPDTAVHPSSTSTHRWSSYVTGRLAAGTTTVLAATVYGQPSIDDPSDYRILSEIGLGISITRTLSFTVDFMLRYDSRPPDDVVSLDTELRNGVQVAF